MSGPGSGGKAAFWDRRISAWEASRYSLPARLNPFSWTVRGRMNAARRLVRDDFARHPHILDLGCGSGLLAQAVLEAPGRRYTGVDFSRTAVETARSRFLPHSGRIQFEQSDALGGPEWAAPLIVFLGLLDWLDEEEMRLLFRRLKAENLCFSFTESESGLAGLLYRQYRRCSDGEYRARNFSRQQVLGAAQDGGYRVDRVIRLSPMDPGRLVTASRL